MRHLGVDGQFSRARFEMDDRTDPSCCLSILDGVIALDEQALSWFHAICIVPSMLGVVLAIENLKFVTVTQSCIALATVLWWEVYGNWDEVLVFHGTRVAHSERILRGAISR